MTVGRLTPRSIHPYESHENPRAGCPCVLSHFYQTHYRTADRRPLTHHFTSMTLVHFNENSQMESKLLLDKIHCELEIDAYPFLPLRVANVVLSKVTFECQIRKVSKVVREYITFDLKIPSIPPDTQTVFTYNWVKRAYQDWGKSTFGLTVPHRTLGLQILYGQLKRLYHLGRNLVNPDDRVHGNQPAYDHMLKNEHQYIRHSEQMLAAYLSLPEASELLYNRLKTTIRAKHADVVAVTVHNMALHIHSTKRCCSACEYVLIGLMNDREHRALGLIPNFLWTMAISPSPFPMSGPINRTFKVITTVTANDKDAAHRTLPRQQQIVLQEPNTIVPYFIPVNSDDSSKRIFTTFLNNPYDPRKLEAIPELNHTTVMFSGSDVTQTNQRAIREVERIRLNNLENPLFNLSRRIFHLKIS